MLKTLLAFCLISALPLTASAKISNSPAPVRESLLQEAISSYETHADKVLNQDKIIVVDYSLHSSKKRLFVLDLHSGDVNAYHVTHGKGSDKNHDGILDQFDSTPGSYASPQGAYVTAEEYYGKHGRSLRLDGLDATNLNARDRAIVVHSAAYAEPDMIKKYGKLGRSQGCLALSAADLETFLADLPKGTLIYVNK